MHPTICGVVMCKHLHARRTGFQQKSYSCVLAFVSSPK
jgi:hypothetical protein